MLNTRGRRSNQLNMFSTKKLSLLLLILNNLKFSGWRQCWRPLFCRLNFNFNKILNFTKICIILCEFMMADDNCCLLWLKVGNNTSQHKNCGKREISSRRWLTILQKKISPRCRSSFQFDQIQLNSSSIDPWRTIVIHLVSSKVIKRRKKYCHRLLSFDNSPLWASPW